MIRFDSSEHLILPNIWLSWQVESILRVYTNGFGFYPELEFATHLLEFVLVELGDGFRRNGPAIQSLYGFEYAIHADDLALLRCWIQDQVRYQTSEFFSLECAETYSLFSHSIL